MRTAAKEHPIIFSGEMVRAILAGRKTQTRRVIKPQPEVMHESTRPELWWGDNRPLYAESFARYCPYGLRSQRLWVREAWGLHDTEPKDGPDGAYVYFKATDGDRRELRYQKWRPSIHMPRWASRLTLEIVDIRVERLRDISEADAIAEGVKPTSHPSEGHKESFATLWDEINSKRDFSWQANP